MNTIFDHIISHYTLQDTRKLYLPEELNLSKMYDMQKEHFPQH